ncbi:MAG: xanthine dehydrogenase family protein molybdopterin-binding subunit, partial [Acidimicrobiales bacterium]
MNEVAGHTSVPAGPQARTEGPEPSVAAEAPVGTDPMLGRSTRRVEDPPLLTGRSRYVADLPLDDALVAHYVTSIEAHAQIVGIDTDEAESMPGVVTVVTGADLGHLPLVPGLPATTPRPVLATDRVRFVGEPVAVVVATSTSAAADAAETVVVDYDPLPAVVDPGTAATSPTLLFDDLPANVALSVTGPGDADPVDFSAYDVVVTGRFVNQRLAPCPLETRVAASEWTDDGRLLHHASCQGAHPIKAGLATFYGLEPEEVRVITRDVGGSFGAKARFYPEDMLLPELARRTGRPVRWLPPRGQDMVGLGHSRAQIQTVTVGGDRDGTIRAIEAHILADIGAYPVTGGALARNTGMILPGPFGTVEQVHFEISAVVTNTTPQAAYRGAGRPEAGALLDRAADLFAVAAGVDPIEVRRRSLLTGDDLPWTNPTGVVYDSGDYRLALEQVADAVGYDEIRADQARQRRAGEQQLVGVGLSTFIDRTAGIPSPEYGALELRPDGTFRVLTGSSPSGQGHHTTWAQWVAERTGVPVSDIEVVHGDTDIVPRG